jgi:homoserine dehydrogenase
MKKLNIGLLGYGTVGKSVASLLQEQEDMNLLAIFRRQGKADDSLMTDQIDELLLDPQIEVIVEVLGGLIPAYDYSKKAILNGKHVVTANKALVNAYGQELNQLSIEHNVSFLFSAACGGGIPFLPTMIQHTSSIRKVGGILNGTTNFIIDKMERDHLGFNDALKQAQASGYAEADPSSDLDGIDTMYKLRLALAIGMHTWIDLASIDVEGIRYLKDVDIKYFTQQKYKCRLMAYGEKTAKGFLASVEPSLVELSSLEAHTLENNNLAWFENKDLQRFELSGQGAGGIPTAMNILRDLSMIQEKTSWTLPSLMNEDEADNQLDHQNYLIRTPIDLNSSFLEKYTGQSRVFSGVLYRILIDVPVSEMHKEVLRLREKNEVFFART